VLSDKKNIMLNYFSAKIANLLACIIAVLFSFSLQITAQTINMTNGGNSSVCGGTFYDPGGTGNYSGGNSTITHTICSSTPGEFPQINFTSFNLFSNGCVWGTSVDRLYVYDGPNTSSPLIGNYRDTDLNGQTILGASGCLTFRFVRENNGGLGCANNNGAPGWSGNISCVVLPPSQETGDNCFDASPFCSDQSYNFPNTTSGSAPVGPDYGCLGTQPKPIWYYLKIGQSGTIELDLSQSSGDIDFAMWGPFTSLPLGCNIVMGGSLPPLQCSYSTSATETIAWGMLGGTGSGASTPPNAQVGEYYIVLMTNFNGSAGTISLNQTGGTGATDCSIVDNCLITNFTANISACTNDLYTVNGVIEVINPPDNGDLIVEDCNGDQTIVASAPFTASLYNYTLSNLNADGIACDVEVYFSDEITCSQIINYTAPVCAVLCNFDLLDISILPCNGINKFDITGSVEFTNPPSSGQLVIEDCSGNSAIFNAPFTSPQSFTISGIDADGANCNITASFTADPTCTIDIDYVNVVDCSCSAQIGTFDVITDGTQIGNNITLCEGQEFFFLANGDYTPADDIFDPTIAYDPGIWWAVYSCPPTVGTTPAPGVDISTDPCLVTFVSAGSITDINDMGFINSFPAGTFTDNTIYFVPLTMYNITDGYYSLVNTTTPCYQMGAPYSVQYLPPVDTNKTSDCIAGTVSVEIWGGSPEINGTDFTATNLLPATASFVNNTVGNNGTIVVSGLQDGDAYSFEIADQYNCSVTISGTFQGLSASGFSYSKLEYCQDETNPLPVLSGASGGTYTASPSGLSINASTGVVNLISSTVGDYVVTYESPGAPCNSTTDVNITVDPVPTFTLSHTDPLCGNNDGVITISGLASSTNFNLNYSFDGTSVGVQSYTSDGTGEILINNLGQGTYTNFTIENPEGCSYNNPNSLSLNDVGGPSVTAPNDEEICIGETVTFTALNPDGATITWDNSISDGVAFTPTASGVTIFTVTATDLNNCTTTDEVELTVHDLPIVDASQGLSICEGESTTINATGATTYNWDNSIGGGASHSVSPTITTTYEVTGTNSFGCINTDQVIITVNENPVPVFEGDSLRGCEPHLVNFTDNSGVSGVSCTWDFGDGNTSSLCGDVLHNYTTSGVYDVSLTITDVNGCSGTTTTQNYIEVYPKPIASFEADPMVTGTSNPIVNFSNTSQHGTDFIWNFGDNSPLAFTYDATHTYSDIEGGEYIVTLIASNGPECNDTAKAVIKIEEELIYYVPNSFTPDADNFNETFKPIFTSGFDPLVYNLKIFNRWGEIIFESNDANYGWDGTYGEESNQIVKTGVYIWKIEFKNKKNDKHIEVVGHVNLLR